MISALGEGVGRARRPANTSCSPSRPRSSSTTNSAARPARICAGAGAKGASNVPAFAPDYATLIQGLLDLYEAGFDVKWLKWAVELQKEFDAKYWDPEHGGYFTVSASIPDSVLHVKEDHDSAEPSPNSVAALNLLRLSSMLAREDLRDQAQELLRLFGNTLEKSPFGVPVMITALYFLHHGDMEIVLAGDKTDPAFQALAKETRRHFLPLAVVLHADGGDGQKFLAEKNETIANMGPVGGKAAAYVCRNQTCQAPVTTPEALGKLLVEPVEVLMDSCHPGEMIAVYPGLGSSEPQ